MKAHIEAAAVAREQVAWFKAQGINAADVLRALGDKASAAAGWDDVYAALGAAWIGLAAKDALLQGVRRVTRSRDKDEARP